jgi:hypothetical protein
MAKEDEEIKINHNNHKMLNTLMAVDKRYTMQESKQKPIAPLESVS